MKKMIMMAAIVITVAIITFMAGRSNGVNHVLSDAWFEYVDGAYNDPDGRAYAGSVLIELDGHLYQQGLSM